MFKLTEPNILTQSQWLHPAPYGPGTWTPYNPTMWVIHWGGVGPYNTDTPGKLAALMRGWRAYHMSPSKGNMRDIAYNYVIGQDGTVAVGRGENQNGAHWDSNYWGKITRTVCWTLGTNTPDPTPAMYAAFARIWLEDPKPVTGHGLLPTSPSNVTQHTVCPGPKLREYIQKEQYILDIGTLKLGDSGLMVRSLRRGLNSKNYRLSGLATTFSRGVFLTVQAFQREHQLPVTGVVDEKTLRALRDAAPRSTPYRWLLGK